MKILFRLNIVVLLSLLLTQSANADIAAITVSPVSKTIVVSQGEEKTVIFTAYNSADKTQHVYLTPRQWFMRKKNRGIPVNSWLNISPSEFDIGPGEKREIAFKISPPSEATGELAAMIAFKPKPEKDQPVNVVFSVSLYAMIKDTQIINCKISNFKLWKYKNRDALGARVVLKNDGNLHLNPRISVFIQDIFKKKNLQKAVLRYGKPVYPGKGQGYEGAIYNFKLRPGVYRAVIDGEYTNVAKRFKRNVYFLVGWKGKILYTFFKRSK